MSDPNPKLPDQRAIAILFLLLAAWERKDPDEMERRFVQAQTFRDELARVGPPQVPPASGVMEDKETRR